MSPSGPSHQGATRTPGWRVCPSPTSIAAWIDPNADKETFRKVGETWLADLSDLRPRSAHRYYSLLDLHLLPTFGDTPMTKGHPFVREQVLRLSSPPPAGSREQSPWPLRLRSSPQPWATSCCCAPRIVSPKAGPTAARRAPHTQGGRSASPHRGNACGPPSRRHPGIVGGAAPR